MKTDAKKVLVTGAGGFIGRLLTKALLAEDVQVRSMVRKSIASSDSTIKTIQADLLEPATLRAAMDGIDTAFYLVHLIPLQLTPFDEAVRRSLAADKT